MRIGNRRELFVDQALINVQRTTAKQTLQHPVRREVIFKNDAPWECNGWVYYTAVDDGIKFRLYYLCFDMYYDNPPRHAPDYFHVCYAESVDGVHWVKPDLGLYKQTEYPGNNIIMVTHTMDAFHVFLDENPACPPEEKYKAVYTSHYDHPDKESVHGMELRCMFSADGIHFRDGGTVCRKGAFDSHNAVFFDTNIGKYVGYVRDFHNGIRHVRRITSDDFRTWSDPVRIAYNDEYDFHMYTNGVRQYPLAPHYYVGLPARYVERGEWTPNYDRLCGQEHRKWLMQMHPRYGLAVTDGLLMTSRDGEHFNRFAEAFLRPGPESEHRWIYGDCYACNGLLITPPLIRGESRELSIYVPVNCWSTSRVEVLRYTLRLDGFVSYDAPYTGGEVVTKPIVFSGDTMRLNFATSAVGSVRIVLEDTCGNPIPGYDSGELFGDSTDRIVDFPESLSKLNGQEIVLRFLLKDASIYSYGFTTKEG